VDVLALHGDLDLDVAATFCGRVDTARERGCRRLVIDLTQLRFCDARALRALIGAAGELIASAGRVALVRPAEPAAARVFAVTVPGERLSLHSDVNDAVARLAR
jgi:anti-anti-sigma factor